MIDQVKNWNWHHRGTLGPQRAPHLLGPCVVEDANGRQIVAFSGWRTDEQVAQARLMAAAPDLLRALLYVLDCVERGDTSDMQPVRSAIAQAVASDNAD